ncbi:Ppx/GppA family phosphatase [Jeotgalibacillus haloalkalitolerans]|uniref:Ppx/GppA family phosphatase n=1 Tax=Jeotgalibacillus haloalkalitolerans TaxID=3104292 RepID=A0ABU5KP39_9BACL|nr:Ppx/GppA family phosphatase [Jeotgalibacillus sp. HH7-29]MDZ5712922.1 Ppx/GppA family phosphatase [Jeotgalibacillus sp. HH7-29]
MKNKTAVIDIGSNTIRLVLYEYDPDKGMKEIENIKTVARLKMYLDDQQNLTDEGAAILEEALLAFNEIIDFHQIKDVRAAATAAVRQAENSDEIVSSMKKKTGISIKILTEEEEAYFGYLAVVHSTPVMSAVTIDIGGGSTEVTYYEHKQLQHSHSFPFGAVSLKKDFVSGEQITKSERKKLIKFIRESFLSLEWLSDKKVPIVAIGGSARNIAQIHQQSVNYPIAGVHQYWMTEKNLQEVNDELIEMTEEELEKLDGLSSDRTDIIAPASQVFCELYDIVDAKGFMFSRKGLRDGIVFKELMKKYAAPLDKEKVFLSSMKELAFDYAIEREEAEYMISLASELYSHLGALGELKETEKGLQLLKRAAFLYYLGEYIDSDSSSQHTFYIIANRSIDGVLHKDRIALALAASFKSKSMFNQFLEPFDDWFSDEELHEIRLIGSIIKLAYSLNGSKRNLVNQIEMRRKGDELHLRLYAEGRTLAEEYQAGKQKKHLEKTLKKTIVLDFIPITQKV